MNAIRSFATAVLGLTGGAEPPKVTAAMPIPAIATTNATAATSIRRADEGSMALRGSRTSISGQRSGADACERESNRSWSSGIFVVLQEISEPAPASHQVDADRRLGRTQDPRDLARRVPGAVVEND